MSKKQRVASRLIVGFENERCDQLKGVHGVVFYRKNISSPEQLKKLSSNLCNLGLSLYVDQEGGRVSRLSNDLGFFSGRNPMLLSIKGVEEVRKEAAIQAKQLKKYEFTMTFAPCVDLATGAFIGARSYGKDVEHVVDCAAAFIEEHRKLGIKTCLKHFPGHGSSNGDTHYGFVDVTSSWNRNELDPYALLIREGLVDSVMVSHVVHRDFDAKNPASLSEKVIKGFLREELGFKGTVITDDLCMKAIKQPLKEAVDQAIDAGADLVIAKDYFSET